jgi:hypothetical protein
LFSKSSTEHYAFEFDAEQASAMEHEGVPGMVHITQHTLDLISIKDRGKLIIKG